MYIITQIREKLGVGIYGFRKKSWVSFHFFPKMVSSSTTMVDYPEDEEKVIDFPYRASDRFLSEAEYSFYMVAKKS